MWTGICLSIIFVTAEFSTILKKNVENFEVEILQYDKINLSFYIHFCSFLACARNEPKNTQTFFFSLKREKA